MYKGKCVFVVTRQDDAVIDLDEFGSEELLRRG